VTLGSDWTTVRIVLRGGPELGEVDAKPVLQAGSGSWVKIAFAMFAVGWGANQFSPMLIVYRHELRLGAGVVAGLFLVYALTLIPGLLIGGPASDRFGRRPVVLPFVVLSPLATLLLVLGPRSLALICAGRALAGLCSGVVFGSATAWVQELSYGAGQSARRAALALTAGFGLGPAAAAVLAQWAPDPLALPYLPHLVIGVVAAITIWRAPGGASPAREPAGAREPVRWPPTAVRTRRFWLAVAPASPMVFGSVSLAMVVLPEDVTSARTLSAGFAGLMTALTFSAGIGVQPLARRLDNPLAGVIAGLCCAAAGAGTGVAAVADADRVLAGIAAVLLGLAFGLCLVSGLRQAEQMAGPTERGAVVACYYALGYLGFAAPYLVAGLAAVSGQAGAFGVLAGIAIVVAAWMAGYRVRLGRADRAPDPPVLCQAGRTGTRR
jgi:predicted MFS family arabinose efflux permease